MIDIATYRSYLSSYGKSVGEVRKKQSMDIINATFTNDPAYKKVRVLTQDGWELFDAKYQYHQMQSIAKDDVDWYLQFRPGVHFPIGTYVIIPDDDDDGTPTYEDQVEYFKHHESNLSSHKYPAIWFIVYRDKANAFVRYNVLQCNWNFQWVYDGRIQNCIGALRSQNSYTSGIWKADYSVELDSVTGAWMPDIHAVYPDSYKKFGMCDNRTIIHGTRFMLTNNSLDPSVYMVSKALDMYPQGVIKYTFKQSEYDPNRDNVPLRICDYSNRSGNASTDEPYHYEDEKAMIMSMKIAHGELVDGDRISYAKIPIGEKCYFGIKDWDYQWQPDWRVRLMPEYMDDGHPASYYEKLIRIQEIGKTMVCVSPGKAKSLVGKKFTLCVCDADGYSHSSITLEVDDAT